MKKWMALLFGGVFFTIAFSACKKHAETSAVEQNYAPGSKLSRIVLYASAEAPDPIRIVADYEYDAQGRISRVVHPFLKDGQIADIAAYESYLYNADNQLVEIQSFNKNLNFGYLLLKKSVFLYDANGNKIKEQEHFPQINSTEYNNYSYKEGRLWKMEHLNAQGQLTHYMLNDYNQVGQLVKESFFAAGGKPINYTLHIYKDGKNLRSTVYNASDNTPAREIIKSFDKFGNLVILSSKELSLLSSMADYTHRYEYLPPPATVF